MSWNNLDWILPLFYSWLQVDTNECTWRKIDSIISEDKLEIKILMYINLNLLAIFIWKKIVIVNQYCF